MRRSMTLAISGVALSALLLAACTSNGTDETASETPARTPQGDESAGVAQLLASVADGWSATTIGSGIKPALALDGSGSPAVAYLLEAVEGGFVAFSSAAEGWTPDTVAEGYFYGPLDLAFDPQGRPNIVYHDHQGDQFQEDLGDLTYALREGDWQIQAAEDDGHDGWDSAIAIGADGVVRAAGIDPAQFGRTDGVEYYELRDGVWNVTAIGSGAVPYEFNVSLALGSDGLPALSYYNDSDGDLIFASFDGASWNLETVASEGDVGKFSSLQFDAEGRPHVTFFEDAGDGSGRVLYAVRDGGRWTQEEIATLDKVEQGMTGARRITSLALDPDGIPHVAFSNTEAIQYAVRSSEGWQVQEIVTAGERPLGQLVSLKLDAGGTPHLAFFEVTSAAPLDGVVVYLTQG